MSRPVSTKLLKRVRALVLDVDGVLTDGGMYYSPQGEAMKRFDVKDGLGLRRLRDAGVAVAFISGENSEITRRRAEKLKIEDVFVGIDDKLATLKTYLSGKGIALDETAYVGDDLVDLAPLKAVGLPITVADAVPEVLKAAAWVTTRKGGHAAVREICDRILAAK